MTPIGTETLTAKSSVQTARASVGSTRWAINSATVFLKKKLSPKLPCSTLPIQIANCVQMGSSRPSLLWMSAIWSEVALSPAMTAAGSPGVNRSMRKTKIATTARTGMMAMRRRAIKSSIFPLHVTPGRAKRNLRSAQDDSLATDGWPCCHFFSMFHITGTGAFSQPETLERMAPGPYHWPTQPYCAVCKARA